MSHKGEYLSGGYYLALRSKRTPYMSPDLIPERVLSASTCICDFFPDAWAMEWASVDAETRSKEAAVFGLLEAELPAVIAWGTESFGKKFGWVSAFYTLEAAREACAAFLPKDLDVEIFGLGLHGSAASDFLMAAQPPAQQSECGPIGETGIFECVRRGSGIETSGRMAGFELLTTYYGLLTCSWLCGGLEVDCAKELGIRTNGDGLVETHSDAMRCAEYISRDDVGAEPGLWLPWLFTIYGRE